MRLGTVFLTQTSLDFAFAFHYSSSTGQGGVNCTHTDTRGVVWSAY